MRRESTIYDYWLSCVNGISGNKKRMLQNTFATAKQIYYIEDKILEQCYFLTNKERINLNAERTEEILKPRKMQWDIMQEKKMRFITYFSEDYPKKLKEILDPPYALFGLGEKCFEERKFSVAIIGARNASSYGMQMAFEFGRILSGMGVHIICGMARGIDAKGLEGAAGGEGFGCAVLGCGADVCYPKENRHLYETLLKKGRVLSEYPPGTPPFGRNFPRRNRIISGLSDMILVMEAREKSGSLITADFALEQGKDVYALPGPVTSEVSRGCNRLIYQGAGILLSPEEFVEELPYKIRKTLIKFSKNPDEQKIKLESLEKLLYSVLSLYPKSLQEIEEETQLSRGKIMEALLNLELSGWIQEVTKNYYIRLK